MGAEISHYKNSIYSRDYSKDIPFLFENTEYAKRIATAAIPFISIIPAARKPLSIVMGAVRIWNTQDAFGLAINVASVAASILQHRAGMVVTTAYDTYLEISNLRNSKNKEEAFKGLFKVFNNLVYLTLITQGGLELSILASALQMATNLIQSREDFGKDRWIEGIANLGMATYRLHQCHTQYNQYKKNAEIAEAIKRTQQVATVKELPKEIIAKGQWVIADMDGTLIGAPGDGTAPRLDESAAKESIFNWLRAGGNLLIITGSGTQQTLNRFTRFIPNDLEKALIEKRLLLATNGGATICHFDGKGWIEDSNYQNTAIEGRIAIPKEKEALILENSAKVINDFYRDLRKDDSLIPDNLKSKYKTIRETAQFKHAYDFTVEELIANPSVPRIETRRAENGEAVQICIIGIPADLKYDVSKLALHTIGNLELCKVGVTHEINIAGVDKALPIRWLQKGHLNYPELKAEKSVAVGDRPNHNDAPLTTAVGSFVSVCEQNGESYIPKHVKLRIGHNENGSKQLFERLLDKAKDFNKLNRLEPVIVNTLEEVVQESANSFVKQ